MRLLSPALAAWTFVAVLLPIMGLIAGCHSYHIEATIKNHTGGTISLLEVDYPSASFGSDKLAADADFHYRFQTRGSGPLTVQYTAANGHQAQMSGPTLYQPQQGRLDILLLP